MLWYKHTNKLTSHYGRFFLRQAEAMAKETIQLPAQNQRQAEKSVLVACLQHCSNNQGAKRALNLVHTLLGEPHTCWTLEIASFLSRWRWAGPSSITNCSGNAVGLMILLAGPQQAKCRGTASFIFSSDTHSVLLSSPLLTLKAQRKYCYCENKQQVENWDFFFFTGAKLGDIL